MSRAGTDLAWRLRRGGSPSVAETFEWSLAHLDPEARVAFSRLGVFAGSFTREMATALLADVPTRSDDVIDRLVRSALVTPSGTAPGRVRLLDSAREVARRLAPHDEPTAMARRHATLMLDLALLHGPRIRTADEAAAAEVLRADFADHRLAMAHLMEAGRWSEAAQLLCAVFQFCHFQPLDEANEWALRVARHLSDDDPLCAEAAGAAALGAWFRGDLGEAVTWGTKATAVAERTGEPAFWARLALVDALSYGGGPAMEQLGQHFGALTAASRISPEPFWQINGLGYEVTSLVLFGKVDKARRRADEALSLARALGNPDCLHWALHCLGRVLAQDDPRAALVAYEAAFDAAMSVDSRWNACLDLIEVASLLRRTGDVRAAAQRLLELLAMLQQSGNRSQLGQALLEASQLLESVGDLDSAASLLLGQRELPRMPTAAQPSPGSDRAAVLRSRLGPKWPALEARAAATPVHALVTRARTALADVGGR